MIDVSEAYSILSKKNPGQAVRSSYETSKGFIFLLVPVDAGDDYITGIFYDYVDKESGNTSRININDVDFSDLKEAHVKTFMDEVVNPLKKNEIYHYGMPRRSGRYPWGSGKRPFQSKELTKGIFNSGYAREESHEWEWYDHRPPEKLSEMKRKDRDYSIAEDGINSNYDYMTDERRQKNCVQCALAMEMRRRGYDVQARGNLHGSDHVKAILDSVGGEDFNYQTVTNRGMDGVQGFRAVRDSILKTYDGEKEVRGMLITDNRLGGRHATYFDIQTNDDGTKKWKFLDPQISDMNEQQAKDRFENYLFNNVDPTRYQYIRLDDKKFTDNIGRYVESR